jgi:integrase
MVNRDNWKLVKKYLAYQQDVLQRDPQTVDRCWCSLRHLLEWANSARIANVRNIRPVFPAYLAERGFVHDGVARSCNIARAFFTWLKEEYPGRYTRITDVWLDTLRPAREAEKAKTRDVYTLEDVHKIAGLPAVTLVDQRDIAAVALLFLSGMRVGAFTSLTVSCVDLRRRAVRQWPELGVHTKGGKRAETYLRNVADLLRVVRRWDKLARARLPESALWYAPLGPAGVGLQAEHQLGSYRREKVSGALKRLCALAGVAYRSPHKLRHGHAVYALSLARNVADLKAISQNLMHSDLRTTDQIYAILGNDDVMTRIGGLTK